MQTVIRDSLARKLYRVGIRKGPFRLRSGEYTSEYFDKYLIEADPKLLRHTCESLQSLLPEQVDGIAAMELGGIPIATVLSQLTDLPLRICRKHPKVYGTTKLFEGGPVRGKRLVLIEDVATCGSAILHGVKALRNAGAIVEHALCVLEVERNGAATLDRFGVQLRTLYTLEQLKLAASQEELFD
jgi:orotate phosphoribosyltransferase